MASATTRGDSKERAIQGLAKQVIHARRKRGRKLHASETRIQLVVVRVACHQRAEWNGEKRTKHASLVLGESQLNAGAPEMERSEGSANAFDVSNRRSVDFIFFLCRDRE